MQNRLLERFEGLTYFPQKGHGFWKMAGVTYRDEVVIFRVLARSAWTARSFLRQYKSELKSIFRQEEILIVERPIRVL